MKEWLKKRTKRWEPSAPFSDEAQRAVEEAAEYRRYLDRLQRQYLEARNPRVPEGHDQPDWV